MQIELDQLAEIITKRIQTVSDDILSLDFGTNRTSRHKALELGIRNTCLLELLEIINELNHK